MIFEVSFIEQAIMSFAFTATVTAISFSLFPSPLIILNQFHLQNLHIAMVAFTLLKIHLAFNDLATLGLCLSNLH